jgi:hypothetical protein
VLDKSVKEQLPLTAIAPPNAYDRAVTRLFESVLDEIVKFDPWK